MERLRRLYGRHRMLPDCEGWREPRLIGVRKAFRAELKTRSNGRSAEKLNLVQKNIYKMSSAILRFIVAMWEVYVGEKQGTGLEQ